MRLNALEQRDLPAASDDCRAVDTRKGDTCCVHTYYDYSYPSVGSTDGIVDGIEPIRKLEIAHSRIVLLQSAAILLKSAVKAGGYRINLRGHPAAKREEVLLSFHRSFK